MGHTEFSYKFSGINLIFHFILNPGLSVYKKNLNTIEIYVTYKNYKIQYFI